MRDQLISTAAEIGRLFWIVTKLGRRDLERRLDAHGVGLGGLSFGVLRMLSRRQCTSSELSRQMMLAPATLVPAVDALERDGYVKRSHDPTDRRRAPLVLTARGAAVLAQVPAVHADDALVRGLSGLADADRRQLRGLLRKLARQMVGDEPVAGAIPAVARSATPRSRGAVGRRSPRRV